MSGIFAGFSAEHQILLARNSLPGIATLKPAVNGRGRTLTFGRRPAYLLFYLSSGWDVSDMEFGLSDGYAMPIASILKPAGNCLGRSETNGFAAAEHLRPPPARQSRNTRLGTSLALHQAVLTNLVA